VCDGTLQNEGLLLVGFLGRGTGAKVLGSNSKFVFRDVHFYILQFSCLHRDASALLDPMECTDTAEEQRVHSPPASLVPRIHVILAQKLQHINPLLPACLNKEESRTCKCKCYSFSSHRLLTLLVPRAACDFYSLELRQALIYQGKFF
jgi:hypothetical protein